MPEFSDIIQTLRNQERELEAQLAKVRAAREALESVGPSFSTSTSQDAQPRTARRPGRHAAVGTAGGGKPSKKFSAATRAKMAAAQRARWAKKKKDSETKK
jgi:hypothetical protein